MGILFHGAWHVPLMPLELDRTSARKIGVHVNIWGYKFNCCFVFSCPGWMENEWSSALWPGRSPCLPQPGSCWIKGALWMKSQTAVSGWSFLCHFPQDKEHLSEKRFSICIRYGRKLGDTLVNGDKAEKLKECHLPDKLYCAAVIHKHTATLSVPLSHTLRHKHRAALKHKLEMAWKTFLDTIPGLDWLCFTNGARLRVQRHLFARSL